MSHVYAPLAMTGLKVELWKLTRMQLQVASLDCRQHHQTVLKENSLACGASLALSCAISHHSKLLAANQVGLQCFSMQARIQQDELVSK